MPYPVQAPPPIIQPSSPPQITTLTPPMVTPEPSGIEGHDDSQSTRGVASPSHAEETGIPRSAAAPAPNLRHALVWPTPLPNPVSISIPASIIAQPNTEASLLHGSRSVGYRLSSQEGDRVQRYSVQPTLALDRAGQSTAQQFPSNTDLRFPPFDPTVIQTLPNLDGSTPPADGNTEVKPPETPGQSVNSAGLIDLTADRQDYDSERRIFSAEGNVRMLFRGAVLQSDRLKVNLVNRFVVAEGNVSLTRGQQILEGERFEYDLLQESGIVYKAKGDIFLPSSNDDFTIQPAADAPSIVSIPRPLGDDLAANQPKQPVNSPGGVNIVLGSESGLPFGQPGGGELRRFRFEAEEITFMPNQWFGRNVRITNDPFSPPQLEIRADEAKYTVLSDELRKIETSSPRLVLDQSLSIPIPRSQALLREDQLEQAIVTIGIDGRDRDGIFIERSFPLLSGPRFSVSITPQLLVQRGLNGSANTLDSLGLVTRLDARLSPRTSLTGIASFGGLDLSKIDQRLRASLRLRQLVGTHTLDVEGSYRDRLFNGSLGFQDVQISVGSVLTSPIIPLGGGFNLTYQAGAQYVVADTDQLNLLPPVRSNNRVGLGRFQTSASLSRGFVLWQGETLPATPTEGMKYTANPVLPYVIFSTGITGISSLYTTGDTQLSLTGSVALQAQFGHFSRRFFDYTGINLGYAQTLQGGKSPFLFDRSVDTRVFTGGLLQQIYGPIRFGFQTTINLDTGQSISTDYILEYSRRAYGVTLRYNPTLQLGSINLRISDFNWSGSTDPFDN